MPYLLQLSSYIQVLDFSRICPGRGHCSFPYHRNLNKLSRSFFPLIVTLDTADLHLWLMTSQSSAARVSASERTLERSTFCRNMSTLVFAFARSHRRDLPHLLPFGYPAHLQFLKCRSSDTPLGISLNAIDSIYWSSRPLVAPVCHLRIHEV